jgi:hypothetical protein
MVDVSSVIHFFVVLRFRMSPWSAGGVATTRTVPSIALHIRVN